MELFKKEIIRGSFVLFVMMGIFNFLNYVFHFSMARMLVPAQYGILAILMAIINIFDIPAEGIQTIISRYTSKFNVNSEYGKMKYLLTKTIIRIFFMAIIAFLIYIPVSFFLSYFIDVDISLLLFTGILLFAVLLFPALRGILQGRKKFMALGFSMIIESALRVIIAVSLVFLGMEVYGAISGVSFGALFALLISFLFINEIRKAKIEKVVIEKVFSYNYPILMATFTIILISSLDIILAKRFFSADLAGKYAAASMLGKIVFFGTSAISRAMFPITSEGYYKNQVEGTKKVFRQAFFIVLVLCGIALLGYLLFPKIAVLILFGNQYLEISNILIFIGIAFTFLSLTNLSLIYALSVHKKGVSFFFIFVFLEILIFSIFHQSLRQFSIAFIIINLIMFIASLIFILKD